MDILDYVSGIMEKGTKNAELIGRAIGKRKWWAFIFINGRKGISHVSAQ